MLGYVKWHREFWKHPVIGKDGEHILVWLYLYSHAAHTGYEIDNSGNTIVLKPGQLITSITSISDKTGVSRSKVQRILNNFKGDMLIDTQTNNKNSLISILVWDKFQNSDTQNDTQSQITKSDTQNDTLIDMQSDTLSNTQSDTQSKSEKQLIATHSKDFNNKSDTQSDTLSDTQSDNIQECINKNVLNKNVLGEKKKRKRFAPPTIEEVKTYVNEKGYSIDPERFCDYYIANGWTQGKGKPIVDWKAAVRTWAKNDFNKNTSQSKTWDTGEWG